MRISDWSSDVCSSDLAYLVRFLAVSLNTLEAGLGKIRPSMDDAARALGARPLAMLARVHAPMMWSTLLTAGLLVFVDVMKELQIGRASCRERGCQYV